MIFSHLQTVVLCQNMISCHNGANFKNPDHFSPERWLVDDSKSSTRCTEPGANIVVPFGIGKRQCPGRRFVEMELMLILAKVRRATILQYTRCNKMSYLSSVNVFFIPSIIDG